MNTKNMTDITMMDAGYTPPKSDMATPVNGKAKAPEPEYPTFTLKKDSEYLKGKDIGDECEMVAVVKLKAMSKGSPYSSSSSPLEASRPTEYTMQIVSIGFKPHDAKKPDKKSAGLMDEGEMEEKDEEMKSMSEDELDNKLADVGKKAKEDDEKEAEEEYA